jgi:hypothetical protein
MGPAGREARFRTKPLFLSRLHGRALHSAAPRGLLCLTELLYTTQLDQAKGPEIAGNRPDRTGIVHFVSTLIISLLIHPPSLLGLSPLG